jgi:hypothetical protein
VSPNKIGKRKKGTSKLRDSEGGSGSFEFTHVAVLESADYAGQGTVCVFRVADHLDAGRFGQHNGACGE